jgi:hypothetical protein
MESYSLVPDIINEEVQTYEWSGQTPVVTDDTSHSTVTSFSRTVGANSFLRRVSTGSAAQAVETGRT